MKYKGLDLPVFNGETPLLLSKSELYAIDLVEPEATTILRRVDWMKPADMQFPAFLQLAENELERVAEACGAEVVNHEWALYDHTGIREVSYNLDLPPNHTLAAEVSVVDIVPDPPLELQKRFKDGRFNYVAQAISEGRPYIGDACFEDQGVFGIQRDNYGPPAYVWVDIEPLLVVPEII